MTTNLLENLKFIFVSRLVHLPTLSKRGISVIDNCLFWLIFSIYSLSFLHSMTSWSCLLKCLILLIIYYIIEHNQRKQNYLLPNRCHFRLYSMFINISKIQWPIKTLILFEKECRWCAWDLNPGLSHGRHKLIHWAMRLVLKGKILARQ